MMHRRILWTGLGLLWLAGFCAVAPVAAQAVGGAVAGVVVNAKGEVVSGAAVECRSAKSTQRVVTGGDGRFRCTADGAQETVVTVSGANLATQSVRVPASAASAELRIPVVYRIATVRESLVITATALEPSIDRRNGAIYKNTLFNRDDQLFETLDGGINAGQHEGGGKSVEVRRFGFNLDHGGLNGGLKVLIDDVPQNQATQAHGQGYLGQLKSLSPELVDDVDIVNGPFSAEYGDFSALGVIHVRLKEHLDDVWTLRSQGGSFDSYRSFAAWSPSLKHAGGYLSWEHSYTDGPFDRPLHYVRDNFTGNYTRQLDATQSLGFRFNGGRNNFDSSGQIPLDLVAQGSLGRFGYMDPSDGGAVRSGGGSAYYKKDFRDGGTLRLDGFATRSLFDLFSDFTFYLSDPVNGDGIQQHDSRLQEGASAQYAHPHTLLGRTAVLIAGGNLTDNWINVDLFHDKDRRLIAPVAGKPWTEANAHILNPALYAQEGVDLPHLHLEAGLRFDGYRFDLTDRLVPDNGALTHAGAAEPKFNLVYTPTARLPLALHLNYGRSATSQDARGMALDPPAPKIAATDFTMLGASYNRRRVSASADVFLIDRQHEDVYDPDSGTMDYQGPSRSYGWEAKTSVQLTRQVSWNAALTQVTNAFYRGSSPREYVDSAPHSVANSSLTLANFRGWSGSVRYRHISRYLLVNPDDTSVAPAAPYTNSARTYASGLDVVDFAATKKLRGGLEWNLSVDNLNNKRYYETQNFFDSRLTPTSPVEARVHGTPGYPIGFTTGLTWRR